MTIFNFLKLHINKFIYIGLFFIVYSIFFYATIKTVGTDFEIKSQEKVSSNTNWQSVNSKSLNVIFLCPWVESKTFYKFCGQDDKDVAGVKDSEQIISYLPSGAVIYGYAASKDYYAEKGGFPVGVEGYVTFDGKYYTVSKGLRSDTSFTPDELWDTKNGDKATVIFNENIDYTQEYHDFPVEVYVNLPGKNFTGVGFIISTEFYNGKYKELTKDDLLALKTMVNSIEYIK